MSNQKQTSQRVNHAVLKEQIESLKDDVDELKESLRDQQNTTQQILGELSRYKGFFGGIMLAVSAVTACAGLIWQYIQGR